MNWVRPDARWRWRRRLSSVLALVTLLAALIAASGASARAATPRFASVIVRTVPGREQSVEGDILRSGGRVGLRLPIIHGFSASVPTTALRTLSHDAAVASVTPDAAVRLSGAYDQSGDPYSDRKSTRLNSSHRT